MGSSDSSSDGSSSSSSSSSSEKKKKQRKKEKAKKEKKEKAKKEKAKKEKEKEKEKKLKRKVAKDKDPISSWVLHQSKEEMAKKAEKRRKREQRQAERERADAQAEAERVALHRRLFGATAAGQSSSQAARQAFCPTRPEIGLLQMEQDEMAARMLCGQCKGGKQHSGANA